MPDSNTHSPISSIPRQRAKNWGDKTKRCYFVTPQIIQNDLHNGICPAQELTLLVIDEAHRATGNYAYCEVIRSLLESGAVFRILALSATPGSDTKTVQEVVSSCCIQKIEIRTEDSIDIQQYIFNRVSSLISLTLCAR